MAVPCRNKTMGSADDCEKVGVIPLVQENRKEMGPGAIFLGGKGAGLAEMTKIGLPVPAGFTIATEACDYYYKHGKQFPPELNKQVADNCREARACHEQAAGRSEQPSPCERAIRFRSLDARNDGDDSKLGTE